MNVDEIVIARESTLGGDPLPSHFSLPCLSLSIQTVPLPLRSPFFRVGKCNMAFYLWKYRERKGGSRKGGRKKGGGVSKEVELVVVQQQRGTGILFIKHNSSIFRQSSSPVCGSWKRQASSPVCQTAQSLTYSSMEKPLTGLVV